MPGVQVVLSWHVLSLSVQFLGRAEKSASCTLADRFPRHVTQAHYTASSDPGLQLLMVAAMASDVPAAVSSDSDAAS